MTLGVTGAASGLEGESKTGVGADLTCTGCRTGVLTAAILPHAASEWVEK